MIKVEIKKRSPTGKKNELSAGPCFPVGNFSNTHYLGFTADYFRSNRRFGRMDKMPAKPFGLIAGAGASYYLGKKEIVASYPYRYAGYLSVFLHGGLLYNPCKYGTINLSAGPGIGYYNKTTRFIISANLQASYHVTEKFSIAPAINLMKEPGADPLWSASLKTAMAF